MAELKQKYAQSWIDLARWAPSGGNAQPWSLNYEENSSFVAFRLSIDSEYQKNPSPMDVKGIASAVALGSFFQNLVFIAQNDGFALESLQLKEKASIWEGSAEFIFKKSAPLQPIRFSKKDILERRTDRANYSNEPVPTSLLEILKETAQRYSQLKFAETSHHNQSLIQILSRLEKIRWQHVGLLKSLLREIGFSAKDPNYDEKIPLAQLALSKIDALLLQGMSQFTKIAAFFLKMGFHFVPVRKSVLTFANHCDRIFFIQASHFNFKSGFELGCCFQELWLYTNREKMSFQPCGDGLIALAYWKNPEENNFSSSQIANIKETTSLFNTTFGLNFQLPVLGFRIGYPIASAPLGTRKIVKASQTSGLIARLTELISSV